MRFAALVLLVPLAGCILIAPDFDPVPICPIHGESACGTCLRANCQGEINSCCGTKECRESQYSIGSNDESFTTISALDTCAAGNASGCTQGLKDARSSAAGIAVNSCVANKCRAECVPNTPLAVWTCSTPHGTDECSSCIYASCASAVTGCCDDGTSYVGCPAQLQTEMSACTTGDTAGCAAMANGSKSGKDGVLRSCVTKSCAGECFGNGRTHQVCSLEQGGAYCSCTSSTQSGGDECSSASVPGSHCFFTANGCTCGHYACVANSDPVFPSCECELTYAEDGTGADSKCSPQTVPAKGGQTGNKPAICCLKLGLGGPSCECSTLTSGCATDANQVDSCDKTSFLSALADVKTDTCSQ